MKFRYVAIAILLFMPLVANDYWSPYVEVGGQTNGYRRGTGAMLWTPIVQRECWLLYSQVGAGHWWNNWALGGGLGYRQIIGEMAFGVNGFLDAARSHNHFCYGQGGIGGEFFACGFDFYINGYFSFDNHHNMHSDIESVVVPGEGTELIVLRTEVVTEERAYTGFDLSAGYCFPICGNGLHVSAGYFYYSTRHAQTVAGPRFAAEYRIDNLFRCGTQLRIGAAYEHNRVFGNYGSAVIGIRVPLGCPGRTRCCSPCDLLRRLGDPARRAQGILVRDTTFRRPVPGNGNGGGPQPDPDPDPDPDICIGPDGEPVDLYYVSGDASGTGTGVISDPFTWAQAENTATPFDIIALLGEGGDIPANENFQMQLGQIMVGLPSENCPIVVTPCGPLEAPLTGVRPNVVYSGPDETDVITAASQTQIFGFDVDGQDMIQHVIGGNDLCGVLICDIGGSNTTSGLIRFQRPADLTIIHSNLTASNNNGIFVRRPSGTITIDSNTIADIQGGMAVGISVDDIRNATTLDITNNSIDGAVTMGSQMDTGIFVELRNDAVLGDISVNIADNVPIKNIDGAGIHVARTSSGGANDGGAVSLVINGNELEDILKGNQVIDAILVEIDNQAPGSSSMTFDIKENTVTTAEGNGIAFTFASNDNDPVTAEGYIRDNELTGVGEIGIRIAQATRGSNHTLTIEADRNMLDDVGNQAIFVERTGNNSAQGTLNATLGGVGGVDGNSDLNSSSGDPAYSITNGAGGAICLTMQDNESDRGNTPDIDVTQTSGTLTVYRRDDLSADNNGLDVGLTGTIGTTNTACPTPSFP